jgi:hypothetical protein
MMSLARQKPLQLCVLPMHCPLQAMFLSIQTPLQTYWFGLVQAGRQLTPSQLTVPPVGAMQLTPQELAPQLLRSFVLTQWLLHR